MPRGRVSHGHSRRSDPDRPSPTYRAWQALKARCLRKSSAQYGKYHVYWYEPWRSFDVFLADMGERPEGTTLDRIKGTLPYSSGNCRWATSEQQARNRINNKLTMEVAREVRTAQGTAPAVAERFGISPTLVRKIRANVIWKEPLS